MYYNSIFQQLFKFIPRYRFEKSVKNLSGDRYCKNFSTWQQFLTCLYAQITGKDSLREIASGLATNHNRLYHLGMTAVAKSTLADAMNRRCPDIFKALFEEILDRTLACAPGHGFKFHNPLHAEVVSANQQSECFFRDPAQNNAQIEILGQYHPPNVKKGILRDEIIWFTGIQSAKKFPGELRLVEFFDEETGKFS